MNILAFGEVMLRFTVADRMMLEQSDQLTMSTVGTGVNLLSSLAHFGYETSMLTVLPDNPIGKKAAADVRKLGISDKNILYRGKNLGSFFVELGQGARPQRVTYQDRLSSSFCLMNADDYDFEKALIGVDMVHICGIALSLNRQTRKAALHLAEVAHERHKTVCFDFNYRMSLNEDNNHETMKKRYQKILPFVDIAFGSRRDLTDLLDYQVDDETKLYQKFCQDYQINFFAGSKRNFIDNRKYFEGFLFHHDKIYRSAAKELNILDRIGSGDAFASGILTGLIEKWDFEDILEFAIANSVLAQASMNDSPIFSKADVFHYIDTDGKNDLIR
ncbi:sugar kinase [Companilactobacillus heilongjiangensis]|uniref:2-keto-3-deoxygluconate kinase n=1 Tax=Companilactobacillus heilongjiangensis TaxID=1074467 RepID=A0A0K2L9I3_9LACO|nr:sugar kinase [Companilactobacillus heilongjiangensis]ALB27946.1 2-keto-3-deoxygluconate kinase [Companilactobacillus heilongjiangensis]